MDWKRLLACITGSMDQELLLRNEYLAAENRILRNQIRGRLWLTDGERRTLAEIGKQLGKKALEDTKFCPAFQRTIEAVGVKTVKLPAKSPNLNAFAERWVLSMKNECLSKLILFGEAALRRCLTSHLAHYHGERNHQGKENVILFPSESVEGSGPREGSIVCRERLGGLLKYYYRDAA